MPRGLRRFHQSQHSHFLTFSCYHRQPKFNAPATYDLFLQCLEDMRRRFSMCIYGFVVMPEHVHLLVSEPTRDTLADAMHFLKLAFAKRLSAVSQVRGSFLATNLGSADCRPAKKPAPFWQPRYYDRNVRDAREFTVKLRYLHRNPVSRGLVHEALDWKWSSFRHYALREKGVVEIESQWAAADRETQAAGGPPRVFLRPDSRSPG